MGSIPGWERSPGEGNGNSLQYSRLGNHMNRGALPATVLGSQVRHDLRNDNSMLQYFSHFSRILNAISKRDSFYFWFKTGSTQKNDQIFFNFLLKLNGTIFYHMNCFETIMEFTVKVLQREKV